MWSAHLLCCCVKCEQSSWHPLHTQKETLSELRVLTFGDPIHTQKETTLSELRVLTFGDPIHTQKETTLSELRVLTFGDPILSDTHSKRDDSA